MNVDTSVPGGLLLIAAGLAMLAVFVWSWRGRSWHARWWVPGVYIDTVRAAVFAPRAAMGALPGGGLMLASGGVILTFGEHTPGIVVLPFFLGMLIALVGLIYPFWKPKWYAPVKREFWDSRES